MNAEPEASSFLHNEQQVVRSAGRQAISAFLDAYTCFSVMRASGKVVVFDVRIPIQLAFYALVEHGTFCPPRRISTRVYVTPKIFLLATCRCS